MRINPGIRAKVLKRKEKHRNIRELRKEYSLNELLAFYEVPKSSCLHWKKVADKDSDAGLNKHYPCTEEGRHVRQPQEGQEAHEGDGTVPRMQKREMYYGSSSETKNELPDAIDRYIRFYNEERIQAKQKRLISC